MTSLAPSLGDWTLGVSSKGYPVDLQPTIWPGCSAMDRRDFRKLDTSSLPLDQQRIELLESLIRQIRKWGLAATTTGDAASALKRFVRWVDSKGERLSRHNLVQLLLRYDDDQAARLALLRRAANTLKLSKNERAQLFPPSSIESQDEWQFRLLVEGGSNAEADFLRLIRPGDAALHTVLWRRVRRTRLMSVQKPSDRSVFVVALRDEFRARHTEQSMTAASLVTYWTYLRSWIVWADTHKLALSKATALKALQAYAAHLTKRWRAGSVSAQSVRNFVELPMHLVAGALRKPVFQLKLTLSLPPLKDSGLTSERPQTEALQRFCANLNALILALDPKVLSTHIDAPVRVKLWLDDGSPREVELPPPYCGYGANGIEPRIANLPLTRLRIWAELHRFMAITGCNLSVARSATIADWRAGNPIWKGRAAKHIEPRAGKVYARYIDRHIEFLRNCVPGEIEEDTARLFPGITTGANTTRTLLAKARSGILSCQITHFNNHSGYSLNRWLHTTGIQVFTSRQLRLAKATWLLRRHGGDPLPVSRALGNTPAVTLRHYGGKGNLEVAATEWAIHWSSEELQAALVPGHCSSPGHHAPISDQAAEPCSAGGCLDCQYYRGEDSLEFIHQQLTYQRVLILRASVNFGVTPSIARIDAIVASYIVRHPDQHAQVQQLRERIDDDPHPRFATQLQLETIL